MQKCISLLITITVACLDVGATLDKWLNKLESSGWLSHVKDTLNCACCVAQHIENGGSVLLHGGEGVDTTLMVSALAQIILNPDCRTVVGFVTVLLKLKYNHKKVEKLLMLGLLLLDVFF